MHVNVINGSLPWQKKIYTLRPSIFDTFSFFGGKHSGIFGVNKNGGGTIMVNKASGIDFVYAEQLALKGLIHLLYVKAQFNKNKQKSSM